MHPDRFESFLSENEQRIHNYILRFMDVDEDAKDLVQNVFIAFYDRLKDIDDKTALAYLYRMAHNMAINWQKKSRKYLLKSPEAFQNIPGKNYHPEATDYSILNKAIASLPVKLSTVIHLQYYDNLSYKEISSRLSISVKAVESLLVRAKKLLRKKIMQESGGKDVLKIR
jgi:RNA polymerase sigma-70 factor (ECF subfamily)